jgi:hypothetical protein
MCNIKCIGNNIVGERRLELDVSLSNIDMHPPNISRPQGRWTDPRGKGSALEAQTEKSKDEEA